MVGGLNERRMLRYITTFNQYLGLLRTFFRWLYNKDKTNNEEWETPAFIKRIKTKKPLRNSPYDINDIWKLEDVLTVVAYESELRNQAIITLLWDLDARSHEITALRLRDITLNKQYGEGTIPSNTKTGGGPILLTSSFTYVRDWINKHPFKNEPNARLICNLSNGKPIKPDAIRDVLGKLRSKITRLLQEESFTDEQRQKLEYLLRTKKWNPYCFRHSAITDDSDHLPEFALTKKVRWVMGSKQASRYIKQRMGDELKNKILEHHGIKIESKQQQIVSRACGRCGYANKLESKYCEKVGCAYPLTQIALEEIKVAEQAKFQELINKSNLELKAALQKESNEVQHIRKELNKIVNITYKLLGEVKRGKGLTDDEIPRLTEHEYMQIDNIFIPDS